MTSKAQALMQSFEKLSHGDKREIAALILREIVQWELPPLSDTDFLQAAETIFLTLDEQESIDEPAVPR